MLHWVSAERTSQRAHSLFPMQRCKLTGMNVNFLVRDGPKRRRYMCRAPNAISPRGARSSIVGSRGTPLRPSAASSSFRPCSRHLSASRRALRGRTSVAPTRFKWATMAPLVVVALPDAPLLPISTAGGRIPTVASPRQEKEPRWTVRVLCARITVRRKDDTAITAAFRVAHGVQGILDRFHFSFI